MSVLDKGDKVRALSEDDEQWYPGRLSGQNDDGTWIVEWEDPDGGPETQNTGTDNIKKMFFYTDYKVGDDCRGVSPDDDRWYPGTVAELLGENKFRVKWDEPDEGAETADLHFEVMKRVKVKRNYKEGDEVLAKYPEDGNMYEAKVLKQNDDGTFQVKWDDPDGGPEESPVNPKLMKMQPIPIDDIEVGQKYTGTVIKVDDRGFAFVDFNGPNQGFLHVSKIKGPDGPRVENINDELEEDQEVTVYISGVSDDGKISVSMVEGLKDRPRKPPSDYYAFEDVSADDWFEGEVTGGRDFGVFVWVEKDGAGASGLLHASCIRAGERIEDAMAEFKVGDKIKVRVKNVDADNGKMGLTMLQAGEAGAAPAPRGSGDVGAFEGMDSTQFIEGEVLRVKEGLGAFVGVKHPDTGAEADGLLHITAIKDSFVDNIHDEVEVGQKVQVRVTKVDASMGRMSLSMKAEDGGGFSRGPQDLSAFEGADSSAFIAGTVDRLAPFGAFVTVTAPDGETQAKGLVPISNIRDGFVDNIEDELSVGQEVQVRIVDVNMDEGKMGLTMKAEEGSEE
jgi:small subunit ribosomal protein S1